ncbi:MAG: hypothetical protein IKE81_04270 [Clostridia bacterium]|nr:hypothetical protein [Clostridia bacterium]
MMTKKPILLLIIMSMVLTVCFPAGVLDAHAGKTPEKEIPLSYDLRNVDTDGDGVGDRCYVTPVRFQNPFATCWVFAGISAVEISLLGSVYADDPEAWKTLDLSEKQLGYFSHMLLNDPSSPQNGEGTTAVDTGDMFEVYGGGSTVMAAEAFAQGIGPSDEHPDLPDIGDSFEYHGKERVTVVKYFDGAFRNFHYSDEDDWTIPDELRFHQDYVLMDAHLLPCPAQLPAPEQYFYNEAGTTAIKQQLLQKRGVMINLLADLNNPSQTDSDAAKYISDKWAHYTWDFGSANHAVTIVGWDDHYPKENFLAEHQPPADGAWLAKNSWGSAEEAFPFYASGDWGIENGEGLHTGYFWISYYDHSISEPIAMELQAASVPQSVDQHDYFLPISLRSEAYTQTASMANVFMADHSKTIRAVSCMVPSANTSVHYQVYLLQDTYQTPEDGLKVAEGVTSFVHAGFHRIPVSGIPLQKGQYFSVIVTLANQEGTYDVPMSSTYGLGEDVQEVILNERESYLYLDGQWQDYKTLLETWAGEPTGGRISAGLSYDNFPIKVYSDQAASNARMKLDIESKPLSLLEGINTREYSVKIILNSGFDIGNPSIVWQLLPGSEGILELEPKKGGSLLAVTAKAPGTAMLSVTADGIGTTVFPVTVTQDHIDRVTVVALDPTYTGQEIIPVVVVTSDTDSPLTEGVHYQAAFDNNIRCGLGRAVITGIGPCADPDAAPIVDYFAIVPASPDIVSLSAQSGEIRLSVKDLSDTGADGYEAQYRLKGTDAWTTASFEAGSTDLVISGLAAGEYELQARAFVDNTDAPADAAEYNRMIEYGDYSDIRTVTVP